MNSFTDYLLTGDRVRIRYRVRVSPARKKRGSILLLCGRSEFLEKHEETVCELLEKGYDVFGFDWRGQGLSSRLLPNRHKGFVKDYADYVRDTELFVRQIVLPRVVRPLTILSHSMGGHIAVRFLHDHPGIADRAVFVSPMLDILTSPYPKWLAKVLTRIAVCSKQSHRYAIGAGDYAPAGEKEFRNNKLTRDFGRFGDERRAVEKNPELALGGVTYGWLAATFESVELISQPGYVENIGIPVLIVGASEDRVVSTDAQHRLCARLPNCEAVLFPDCEHEILKESDRVRQKFWDVFDRFVAESDQAPETAR